MRVFALVFLLCVGAATASDPKAQQAAAPQQAAAQQAAAPQQQAAAPQQQAAAPQQQAAAPQQQAAAPQQGASDFPAITPHPNKFCKVAGKDAPGTVCFASNPDDKLFVPFEAGACEAGTCLKPKFFVFADAGSGGTRYKVYDGTTTPASLVKNSDDKVNDGLKISDPTFANCNQDLPKYVKQVHHALKTFLTAMGHNNAANVDKFLAATWLGIYATAGARVAEAQGTFAPDTYDKFAAEWQKQTQGTSGVKRAEGVTISGRLEGLFGLFGGVQEAKKGDHPIDVTKMLYWEIGGASMQWAEFINHGQQQEAGKGKGGKKPQQEAGQKKPQQEQAKKPQQEAGAAQQAKQKAPQFLEASARGRKTRSSSLVQLRDAIMGPSKLAEANEFMGQDPKTWEFLQSTLGNAGDRMFNHVAQKCVEKGKTSPGDTITCDCMPEHVEITRDGDNGSGWQKLQTKDTKGVFKGAPASKTKLKGSDKKDGNKVFRCAALINEVYAGNDESKPPRPYGAQFDFLNKNLAKAVADPIYVVLSSGGLVNNEPFKSDKKLRIPDEFAAALQTIAKSESNGNTGGFSYSSIVVPALVMSTASKIKVKGDKPLATLTDTSVTFAPSIKWKVVGLDWDVPAAQFLSSPKLASNKAVYSTAERWVPNTDKEDAVWKSG